MLQKQIVKFPTREVKNKRKLQIVISKSARGRLREVPTVVIWLGKSFGILENWSFRRGGRLREVVARRGLTVQTVFRNFPAS